MELFIPPTFDFCAKALFENETIRRYFVADILNIPLEDIRNTKILNPYFYKRWYLEKQGILDIKVELNDNTKLNIEIQVAKYLYWDRRSLFYLAKMYTEDLHGGQDYSRLKKCISISILDFNVTKGEEYHSVYHLRNQNGEEYTNIWEIHLIELKKALGKTQRMDEWVRFFRISSKEELNSMQTKHLGVKEALAELKLINLSKRLRERHELTLKYKRDQKAREDYVRWEANEEGMERGKTEGKIEGKIEGKAEAILELLEEMGEIPETLRMQIMRQTDIKLLKQYLKLAAKVDSIEEFMRGMELEILEWRDK